MMKTKKYWQQAMDGGDYVEEKSVFGTVCSSSFECFYDRCRKLIYQSN